LPGSGWPADGVTELLHDQYGIGELRLLTPALAHLSQEQSRWLLWVSPPYIPYPPALLKAGIDLTSVLVVKPKTANDTLWVLEKALASKSCSAVLAWPGNINEKQIRRLQVASKEGNSWNILFRPCKAADQASPAELRIRLFSTRTSPLLNHTSINLKVIKRRGGWASEMINVNFDDVLNQVVPYFPELLLSRTAEGSLSRTAEGSILKAAEKAAEGSLLKVAEKAAEGSLLKAAEGSLPGTAESKLTWDSSGEVTLGVGNFLEEIGSSGHDLKLH